MRLTMNTGFLFFMTIIAMMISIGLYTFTVFNEQKLKVIEPIHLVYFTTSIIFYFIAYRLNKLNSVIVFNS